jgi:hypothetical protein
MELIRTGAIHASYYNCERQSLFSLAFRANKLDIARELLHMMSLEQILKPTDIVPGYCSETIFQWAASHQYIFNTCWAKAESDPRLTLSDTLDHGHRASIEPDLLNLHCKIGCAKALLGDEEWRYVMWKYGIEKDRYLILSKSRNLHHT